MTYYFQAANYLDIKGLLDLTCKAVANLIKGKSPEEIRKTFNIKNDFSAAEEEQVRKENEWCDEKWSVLRVLEWLYELIYVFKNTWVAMQVLQIDKLSLILTEPMID